MTNRTQVIPSTRNAETTYAIEVSQLTKTYEKNVKALDCLTFSVNSGSIFGLLGPNGAGKSTVIKIMTTLTQPDSGEARIAGLDVIQQPDKVRKSIGYVAQKSGVDPQCTGRENLMLQGQLYGLSRKILHSRIPELLDRFDLLDVGDRLCRTYSGGMQRKMDIAMGLIHEPNILFLDEPTTGLDPEARKALWESIHRLSKVEGLTVVLTTHYLEEADQLADLLAIINFGKLVVEGSPEVLKAGLNGDSLQIELVNSSSREEIQRMLQEVDGIHEILLERDFLHVRSENGAVTLPVVLGALEAGGINVSSATIKRPSLDDVYLQYTGKTFNEALKESDPS